jgi:hypothetical protein
MSPQHQAHIVVEIGSNRVELSTGNPKVHRGADHKWGKAVRSSQTMERSLLESDEFKKMTGSLCALMKAVEQSAFGVERIRVEATGAAKEFNNAHKGEFPIAVYRASLQEEIPPILPLIHRDPEHLNHQTVYGEQIMYALYSEKSRLSEFFKRTTMNADILVIRSNQTDIVRAGQNFSFYKYDTPVHFKFDFKVNDSRILVLNQPIEAASFTFSQVCNNQEINPKLRHRDLIVVGKAARQLIDLFHDKEIKSSRKRFNNLRDQAVSYSLDDLKKRYKNIQDQFKSGDIEKEDAARILRNLAFFHSILSEKNKPDARIILTDTKPVFGLFDVFKSYNSKFNIRIAEAGVIPFFQTFFEPKDLENFFSQIESNPEYYVGKTKADIFIEQTAMGLIELQSMLQNNGHSDISAIDLFLANTYRGVNEEVKEDIKNAFHEKIITSS